MIVKRSSYELTLAPTTLPITDLLTNICNMTLLTETNNFEQTVLG